MTDLTPTVDDETPDELTAEEARALVDDLGLDLYRAQDALAFVGECCDIADREQRTITTADVREWLKGARCGRQLPADGPACSCGGRFPTRHLHADVHEPVEQSARTTPNNPATSSDTADNSPRADAEAWRHKAIRRALKISKLQGTIQAVTDLASEEITARTEWGDGYRAALADLQEALREFGHLPAAPDAAATRATKTQESQ